MTVWLKQSTAATVMVGPIVDATDGATAETGFTISQADIRLSKNGGAFAQTNNATGASHAENGWYAVPLDTTDTATLGSLLVNIAESGGLQAWRTFMVVPANVWDSMFGADRLQVHVDEMTADIITAAVLASDVTTELQTGLATASALAAVDTVVDGIKAVTDALPDAGALTSLATASALSTVDGIVDSILVDTGTDIPATLATIAGYIDTEVGAIKAKTDNLPADPADASDIAAAISGLNNISSGDVETAVGAALATYDPPTKAEMDSAIATLPSAAAVSDAVWDEARADHVGAGSFGEGVVASSLATNAIAPSSFQAGSITSNAVAQNAAYEIADAVFARGDIDGLTFDEVLKVFAAILAGKVSGAATATNVFRDLADTLDRVTATADADGNRTAVTINV